MPGIHGQERFFATELTRGPWSNDHQHGGPPTALLARAVEREGPRAGEMFVSRMTFELLRPIPIAAPLEVVTEVLTEGRSVHRIAAALVSGDQQLAVGLAVRIRVQELAVPTFTHDDAARALRPPEQCSAFELPFLHHAVGYHTAMELRLADGEFGTGNLAAWIRPRCGLIEGEESTALQRIMICADAGHGVGAALDTAKWSFVNPDLTVHLHRLPAGGADEWLGMRARTWSAPLGFGMCQTQLSDRRGPLGVAVQSQVISGQAG
ncbi:TesB-like acyl-CoA thioesterase 5 [Enhygromyxa salina]|uniref:TesB-like acyl-CoA thioesterase 5 n=1 Tax=Enhygromyxa salina TaxID=215803 RepID=A0A0C2D8G2_9BACT|nr:TesB-like acyl-CoA thioesterase 5 [Enhygromyxa salina]